MLYKRTGSKYWWVKVTLGGETVRRSSETTKKSQARAFEDRLREQLWEMKKLGQAAYTWDLAAEKWLEEAEGRRSIYNDESIIAWFQPRLTGKRLIDINRACIDALRAEKLKATSRSTVNRYMALLRAILRRARDEWEWIGKIPTVPMYELENPEPRWITPKAFEGLAVVLPSYLERLARFAVLTGLRKGALISLTWGQIDMRRRHAWIPAIRSKNKKPIAVPLSPAAMAVLRTVKGEHKTWVFTYQGDEFPSVNGTIWRRWREAVKASGIAPFRFHDLRHTWASWHIQNGTPLHVLQELGAWSSYDMVQIYAHFSSSHLREWASNIGHSKIGPSRK